MRKAIRTDNGVPFASAWALFGLSNSGINRYLSARNAGHPADARSVFSVALW
jgi:hypothetical protein